MTEQENTNGNSEMPPSLALALQKEWAKVTETQDSFQKRLISDQVFQSIELARERLQEIAREPTYEWLEVPLICKGKIDDRDVPIEVPRMPAIVLGAGAEIAHQWKNIESSDRETELQRIVEELISELKPNGGSDYETLIRKHPRWKGIIKALRDDILQGGYNTLQIKNSFDQAVVEGNDSFLVETHPTYPEQIGEIARRIVDRISVLCSEDRKHVKREMGNWQQWTNLITKPVPENIPDLMATYEDVRIHPRVLKDLASNDPFIVQEAIQKIRMESGFLHEPDPKDFQEMIQHGVVGRIPELAYYGVIIDPAANLKYLSKYCGYDPNVDYKTEDQLPEKTQDGRQLHWYKKKFALKMFQEMDRVAVSVEVAVRKARANATGESRRDSGVATALKHKVYSEVPQSYIMTRHFEILEVDGKPLDVPVINIQSESFIHFLGGRHVGAVEEEFEVQILDRRRRPNPLKIKVLWHLCFASRNDSLSFMNTMKPRRK